MSPRKALQFAIIGPTASGKSALALRLAKHYEAIILSIDSLSLYRGIDIASAKPTPKERGSIPHYGIDLIDPDEPFDVLRFAELYDEAQCRAVSEKRPLILVGGSSFYLKTLLEGISPLPPVSPEIRMRVRNRMKNLSRAYEEILRLDSIYAKHLSPSDRYRIEKALIVAYATQEPPSRYFQTHPPIPFVRGELPLYEIVVERSLLKERIERRTDAMLDAGLIDETATLEFRYGRDLSAMKAIGIREVLDYFDGVYDRATLREKIVTHTARLAKRQTTFNRSQFRGVRRASSEELYEIILREIFEETSS